MGGRAGPVATLAALALPATEVAARAADLDRALAWVAQLDAVPLLAEDADGPALRLRPDEPVAVPAEPLLAESAGRDGPWVRVPAVGGGGRAEGRRRSGEPEA